jgi:hypothetical protein
MAPQVLATEEKPYIYIDKDGSPSTKSIVEANVNTINHLIDKN